MTFDTRAHCSRNNIVSFSCHLKYDTDTKKKVPIIKGSWKKINTENFHSYHDYSMGGFGIMMGLNGLIVIDCDIDKANGEFPTEILTLLDANCKAIAKSPNGKHYYFSTSLPIKKQTNAFWKGVKTPCLDIIADTAFIFAPPTAYTKGDAIVAYQWLTGDLSTVSALPDEIAQAIKPVTKNADAIIKRCSTVSTLRHVLGGISVDRFVDYHSWIKIGIALHGEGIDGGCDLWDEFSRRATDKFQEGACANKWQTFSTSGTEKPITVATLFAWLKEDNPSLFHSLKSNSSSSGLETLLVKGTHHSLAEVFYSQRSDKYIYSPNANIGWYILQTSNIWEFHGKAIDSFKKVFYDTVAPLMEDLQNRFTTALEEEGVTTDHKKTIEQKYKMLQKSMLLIDSAPFLVNVQAWLQDLYCVRDIHLKIDSNLMLYAFTDCVYDFNTATVRAIAPADYISSTCGYPYPSYDDGIKGVEILSGFLSSIFLDDDTKQHVLKTLAYCLCGKTNLQEFYLWKGRGGNGKGMLMSLLERAMGSYIKTLPIAYFVKPTENKGQALPEIALCRTARLVYATEPDASSKEKLQASVIKGLTGDDTIVVRKMYSEPLSFKPNFKLVIQCNDCKFNKVDPALQRRLRVIEFPMEFKTKDLYCADVETHRLADFTLESKLKTDDVRNAFILLLLDYYATYIAGEKEIEKSPAVIAATQEYLDECNPISAWLNATYQYTGDSKHRVTPTDMLGQYNLSNAGVKLSAKQFGEYMTILGYHAKKSNTTRSYHGFHLRTAIED